MFSGSGLVPDAARRGRRYRRQGAAAQGLADVGGKTFKVHLDGYNQLPYLTGQQPKSARNEFYYFNDDGDLVAFRYDDWKIVFCETNASPAALRSGQKPFTCLRVPKLFNLRMDPYERADIVSDQYDDWLVKNDLSHSNTTNGTRRHSCKPSSSIRRASGRRASASIRCRARRRRRKIKANAAKAARLSQGRRRSAPPTRRPVEP